MNEQEQNNTRVIFINAPKIITAKVVRPPLLAIALSPRMLQFAKILVWLGMIALVLTFWSIFRARVFLPELSAVCSVLFVGVLGIQLLLRTNSRYLWRGTGYFSIIAAVLGLVFLNLPQVQRGYARAHFQRLVSARKGKVEFADPMNAQQLGWERIGNEFMIPNWIIELIGGPGLFHPMVMVDLPSDLLNAQTVEVLDQSMSRGSICVSLLQSATKRPPDAYALRRLLNTIQVASVDATYFDATSFQHLISCVPMPYHIVLDGHISNQAIEGLALLSNGPARVIELQNLSSAELDRLSKVGDAPIVQNFILTNCKLSQDSISSIAKLGYQLNFMDFDRANVLLAASSGMRLRGDVCWFGELSAEDARTIASNPSITSFYGELQPLPGAIAAFENSNVQYFGIHSDYALKSSDIESLMKMPWLTKLYVQRSEVDLESIQKLISNPSVKEIVIGQGPLTAAEVRLVNKNAKRTADILHQYSMNPK